MGDHTALHKRQHRTDQHGIENQDDRVPCQLCAKDGAEYKSFNIGIHIRKFHGISISTYEDIMGIPRGHAVIVAPSTQRMLQAAGRKGADYTNGLRLGDT